MVRISIASLIYKSVQMADWVYESVHEFTPMIKQGEAEFFFVANDPTPSLLSHIRARGYSHIEQYNNILSDEELFQRGYAWPEYIHRVYRGYNRAILHSRGEIVVLVNSDHYFSPDWLENLLKYLDTQKIVCSQLVEPKHPKYAVYPSALNGEFGNSPQNFNKNGFLEFAMKNRRSGLYLGGAYMPCMFYKYAALYAGLYPEGNIAGKSFDQILMTGDEAFFDRLSKDGVQHVTAMDSVVYHLKEGEKDDSVEGMMDNNIGTQTEGLNIQNYPTTYTSLQLTNMANYRILIQPTIEHSEIISKLYLEPAPVRIRKRLALFLEAHLPLSLYISLVKVWLVIKRTLKIRP
jgi:hypothetical protein